MTVSTCIMLLELTNNLALLPLVMLVLLVAKVRFIYASLCAVPRNLQTVGLL